MTDLFLLDKNSVRKETLKIHFFRGFFVIYFSSDVLSSVNNRIAEIEREFVYKNFLYLFAPSDEGVFEGTI